MNYILFDGTSRNNLLPFTYTRPVADIRVGILTIREKWEKMLGIKTSTLTKSYLQDKFPLVDRKNDILINASYIPTPALAEKVKQLQSNQAIYYKEKIVAVYTAEDTEVVKKENYERIEHVERLMQLQNTWDIFSLNAKALVLDFELITEGRESAIIPRFVHTKNKRNIFVERGAVLNPCFLNATDGPIYIGRNATIMEGSMVRGGLALCNNATLKMGAKIYGATTVGPYSKVGGELNNVVLFGYSNKGHDGYLGNAVIGEWCNIGAGTNNSNLKNNYDEVRMWSYETENFEKTGLQFCGLMMGDHSKCAINTMFNTGTVVGVSTNVFGSGFPRIFIPSFSWGGASGFSEYKMHKVKEVTKIVMKRRELEFDEVEEHILNHVFTISKKFRH